MFTLLDDAVSYLSAVPLETLFGVFLHAFALLYIYLFLQLYVQVLGYGGRNGILPFYKKRECIQRDFQTLKKYLYYPSVFHAYCSDWFISNLLLIAMIGPILILTGIQSQLGLLICYIVYLSYCQYMNIHFSYPWEALIFELTFLSLFLPRLAYMSLSLVAAPSPLHSFAYRLLMFRLMNGFGRCKFIGIDLNDWSYMKSFVVMQPFPTPLGWLLHHAPMIVHQLNYVIFFIVEIPLPFMFFWCGHSRLIAALATIGLQVAIQSVGSYGYFNLLSAVACIPTLALNDDVFTLTVQHITQSYCSMLTHAVLIFLFLMAILKFPFNSWINASWVYWPGFSIPAGRFRVIGSILRAIQPFHIIGAYGVFTPQTSPPLRLVSVIEGTPDDIKQQGVKPKWYEFDWKYLHNNVNRRGLFVSPFQTRFEQNIAYEGHGVSQHSWVSGGDPYDQQAIGSFVDLQAWNLIETSDNTPLMFRHVPFPMKHAPRDETRVVCNQPMNAARISLYAYTPTSIEELRKTGQWYRRYYMGYQSISIMYRGGLEERLNHTPNNTKSSQLSNKRNDSTIPSYTNYTLRCPELWHPDHYIWMLRTTPVSTLVNKVNKASSEKLNVYLAALTNDENKVASSPNSNIVPITTQDIDDFFLNFIDAISADRHRIIADPPLADQRVPAPYEHADLYKGKLAGFRLEYPKHKERGWWSKQMYLLINQHPTLNHQAISNTKRTLYEKIFARLVITLIQRLLPYYHPSGQDEFNSLQDEKRGLPPPARTKCDVPHHIHVYTWYHLWGLCEHIVGEGRHAYEEVLKDHTQANKYLETFCAESHLFFICYFNMLLLAWHSQKIRLSAFWYATENWKVNKSFLPGFLNHQYRFMNTQFEFYLDPSLTPLPNTPTLNTYLFAPVTVPITIPPKGPNDHWHIQCEHMQQNSPGLIMDREGHQQPYENTNTKAQVQPIDDHQATQPQSSPKSSKNGKNGTSNSKRASSRSRSGSSKKKKN